MPNLLIRALPDDVHRALNRPASMHGRSLQREVLSILADAVGGASNALAAVPSLHVSDAPLVGKVGRKEIYGDHGLRQPHQGHTFHGNRRGRSQREPVIPFVRGLLRE